MNHQLPLDLICEILVRLPIKSLVRFRCVCKAWNDIIDSPYLGHKQLNRTPGLKEDPKLLCIVDQQRLQGDRVTDIFTARISEQKIEMFIPKHFRFQCYCNGLHCFYSYYGPLASPLAILFNPLRQETLELPSSACEEYSLLKTYGLGFDAKNNIYKVICFSHREHIEESGRIRDVCTAELYILGQKSWKPIELPTPLQSWKACYGIGTVFLNGAIHCFMERLLSGDLFGRERKIVAFDIEKEEFKMIKSPPCLSSFKLVELGGRLAVPEHQLMQGYIIIWVLKDYSDGRWTAECMIQTYEPERRLDSFQVVVGTWENEVLLCNESGDYFSHDIKTGRKRKLMQTGVKTASISQYQFIAAHSCFRVYAHQLSLVPVSQ